MLNLNAEPFYPMTTGDLNELEEVDAFNETLADLDLLELQEVATRSVDMLCLDEPPAVSLQAFLVEDPVEHDYNLSSRGPRNQFHQHSTYTHHDNKQKKLMSKNFGRRRC